MKYILITLLFCTAIFAQNHEWGWGAHRYINEHAVDYLPPEMAFFEAHRNFLRVHAVDPDTDSEPGFYHYIDIDYYPEFFNGTLPHNLDSLLLLYSLSIIEDNGTVPWVIDEWTDSLSSLMAAEKWDDVWQIAAELGHYVADAHQPLHLTLNYNGQLTGNHGIHSRYETHMINPRLTGLPLPVGTSEYWPDVLDSTFLYIEKLYPIVDAIMDADDYASGQDPNYGSTYYDLMWQEMETLTTISIHYAIINLASIWQTAWENANNPIPVGIENGDYNPISHILKEAYPNPFNPATTIEFFLPKSENVSLKIYNLLGREVATLVSDKLISGTHTYKWHAGGFASGLYFYKLETGSGFTAVKKLILMK